MYFNKDLLESTHGGFCDAQLCLFPLCSYLCLLNIYKISCFVCFCVESCRSVFDYQSCLNCFGFSLYLHSLYQSIILMLVASKVLRMKNALYCIWLMLIPCQQVVWGCAVDETCCKTFWVVQLRRLTSAQWRMKPTCHLLYSAPHLRPSRSCSDGESGW